MQRVRPFFFCSDSVVSEREEPDEALLVDSLAGPTFLRLACCPGSEEASLFKAPARAFKEVTMLLQQRKSRATQPGWVSGNSKDSRRAALRVLDSYVLECNHCCRDFVSSVGYNVTIVPLMYLQKTT